VQLDGELVALDADGRPDFHRLAGRMLHGRGGIAVTLFLFDVLAVEGLPVTSQPYSERRGSARAVRREGARACAAGPGIRGRTLAVIASAEGS
jgi:ATP-dependent DNA ligase